MEAFTALQMKPYYNCNVVMVYLNYNDLSEETQNRLLENSRKDVE